MGLMLEGFHGFKAGFYLDVSMGTRRLMWTLAHANGTLLGLVNIGFSVTADFLPNWDARPRALASASLTTSSILIPGGFVLGGAILHSTDPGLGILLVPLGALFLFSAVFLTARAAVQAQSADPD